MARAGLLACSAGATRVPAPYAPCGGGVCCTLNLHGGASEHAHTHCSVLGERGLSVRPPAVRRPCRHRRGRRRRRDRQCAAHAVGPGSGARALAPGETRSGNRREVWQRACAAAGWALYPASALVPSSGGWPVGGGAHHHTGAALGAGRHHRGGGPATWRCLLSRGPANGYVTEW